MANRPEFVSPGRQGGCNPGVEYDYFVLPEGYPHATTNRGPSSTVSRTLYTDTPNLYPTQTTTKPIASLYAAPPPFEVPYRRVKSGRRIPWDMSYKYSPRTDLYLRPKDHYIPSNDGNGVVTLPYPAMCRWAKQPATHPTPVCRHLDACPSTALKKPALP